MQVMELESSHFCLAAEFGLVFGCETMASDRPWIPKSRIPDISFRFQQMESAQRKKAWPYSQDLKNPFKCVAEETAKVSLTGLRKSQENGYRLAIFFHSVYDFVNTSLDDDSKSGAQEFVEAQLPMVTQVQVPDWPDCSEKLKDSCMMYYSEMKTYQNRSSTLATIIDHLVRVYEFVKTASHGRPQMLDIMNSLESVYASALPRIYDELRR